MATLVKSFAIQGIDGYRVDIEVTTLDGQPMLSIIGLGVLLSEYEPGIKPNAKHFPARNRIIAAWSNRVIIVEASEGSGALITADIARKYGREVKIIIDFIKK